MDMPETVFGEWDWRAQKEGWHRCRLSPQVKAKLKTRLKDKWWRENWRVGLDKLSTIRWVKGETEKGWKATLEWFVRPDTLDAILDGRKDDYSKRGKSLKDMLA